MIIRKAYRFQLKVAPKVAARLSSFAGCNRYVWNRALEIQKKRLAQGQRTASYADICLMLVEWKREKAFLMEVHSQPLQQVLKDQSRAIDDYYKGTKGFPKFKCRGRHDSFRFPQGFKVDGNRVYLPKIGWVRFRKSQEIEGRIKNVTVSREADRWYVSMQVEMEVEEPVHESKSIIGIDMGVANFATISDGTVIKPLNSFRKWQRRLAKEQKKLSRKIKFSQNWKKQKIKVQRVHVRIANARKDFLHKTTSTISKNHAIVVLEDLSVRNMSASAKGTPEAPGTKVKAKSGLNKSIMDQGWYEFRRQLTYKQDWHGGSICIVDPRNTSITCSKCGNANSENRKSQNLFVCVSCKYEENADLNAARNILAAGLAVLACGHIRQAAV
jgi:putative transposase